MHAHTLQMLHCTALHAQLALPDPDQPVLLEDILHKIGERDADAVLAAKKEQKEQAASSSSSGSSSSSSSVAMLPSRYATYEVR
jgi:hypothetical protein